MAIVKTTNTLALSQMLANNLVEAAMAPGQVAGAANDLANDLKDIAPDLSKDGSNTEQTERWHTEIGPTAASHTVNLSNYLQANKWLMSGTIQSSFAGNALTQVDGGSEIYGFNYASTTKQTVNTGGIIGSQNESTRIVAGIDFDLADTTQLRVVGFNLSNTNKFSKSGFGGPTDNAGGVVNSSSSITQAFRGLADYSVDAGVAEHTGSKVFGYAVKEAFKSTGSGDMTSGAWNTSYNRLFVMESGAGMDFSYDAAGKLVVAGQASAMLFSLKQKTTSGSSVEHYEYANSSSTMDDINPAAIAAYLNATGSQVQPALMALNAELFKGHDTIYLGASNGGGLALAGAGNDRVVGSSKSDEVYGEDGHDIIDGGAGNDFLDAGAGNDTVKGGAGDDELRGGDGDDYLDGGAGHDFIIDEGTGNDTLLGGAGNDYLNGGEGDDYLDGGTGNDKIQGGTGKDTIKGGAGQDLIFGDDGDDLIDGGSGNDLIIGGKGLDVMTGGTGADSFGFLKGDSGNAALDLATLDRITDFNVAQDSIVFESWFNTAEVSVLTTADAGELGQANSYAALLAAAEASASDVVVGYDNANTYIFADTDGDGTMDVAIQLLGIKGDTVAHALKFGVA